jgi:hypothetical protein
MSFPRASVSLVGVPELLRRQELAREDDLWCLFRNFDADGRAPGDAVDPDRLGFQPQTEVVDEPDVFE